MKMQEIFNNAIKAKRSDEMKTSEQLTLGELILKLEALSNKELPIIFDDNKHCPTSIGSWRGSYDELAISYNNETYEGFQGTEIEHQFDDGEIFYKHISTELPQKPKAKDLLEMLKKIKGKTFTGYKGGNFVMGKTTPVWVANYGGSWGFKETDDCSTQAVVDIIVKDNLVIIKTKLIDY